MSLLTSRKFEQVVLFGLLRTAVMRVDDLRRLAMHVPVVDGPVSSKCNGYMSSVTGFSL